jgi:hypothetical protein
MLVTLLAAMAVLIAYIPLRSYWLSRLFAVAGGESVDPSQRVQLLTEAVQGLMSTPFWGAFYVAPILFAACIPLAMERQYLGQGLRSAWPALLSALLGGLLAISLPQQQSRWLQAAHANLCPEYSETLLVASVFH